MAHSCDHQACLSFIIITECNLSGTAKSYTEKGSLSQHRDGKQTADSNVPVGLTRIYFYLDLQGCLLSQSSCLSHLTDFR